MQKLEIAVYPVGHVFYIARSVTLSNKVKTVIDGVEWERWDGKITPRAEKRYISHIEMEMNPKGLFITYWAKDGPPIHRIDHGDKIFGLAKIYSEEEIGMFASADEAFAFAKAKADAGEEYYGPK